MLTIIRFPNNFWGWGGEDDELYYRITDCQLIPSFPTSGTITDLEEMTLDEKLSTLRQHNLWKCMNKSEVLLEHAKTWRNNGILTLSNHQLLGSEFSYEGRVIICTVDVGKNDHWTDLVCKLDDTQMNVPVEKLKEQFEALK